MREAPGNVVPFERPATYWVNRARQYRKPGQLPDAARLMRKALSAHPDPALQLELAQIYLGMASYTASERCLLQALSPGFLTGSACFMIAECALAGDDEDLAQTAFEWCLRLEPEGPYAPYAQDYLTEYAWTQGENLPRGARSESLCRRAQRALMQGETEQALRFARKAWEKTKSCQAALLLGAMTEPKQAIGYFSFAVHGRPGESQPLMLLAQAFHMAGHDRLARRCMKRAMALCRGIGQCEAFSMMAWQMDQSDLALMLAEERLKTAPASVDFWRIKYLSFKHMRLEDEAAQALEMLLDLDPEDAAGNWYRNHGEDMRPYEGRHMLLNALGKGISGLSLPRDKSGPLNRALHLMVMTLADEMDAPTIYRLLPPLWRELSKAEKASCDERENPAYPMALAIYLLLVTGQQQRAGEMLTLAPGRKRLLRLLKKFARRMDKGENEHALY